jgi:hypothetical protein
MLSCKAMQCARVLSDAGIQQCAVRGGRLQALKAAGCQEVVLAISYRAEVRKQLYSMALLFAIRSSLLAHVPLACVVVIV